MADMNRRHFLRAGTATSFLAGSGVLGTLAGGKAFAANTTGYKALVCIFLKGGLDHADTILPLDQTSHDQMRNIRPSLWGAYGVGSGTSSRDRASILALNPDNAASFGSRQFGLPPELAGLQGLFNSGELAVVGNVGPLVEPTNRTEIENLSARLPPRLFSHNDQQSTWMSLGVEGAQYGWGGSFADAAIRSDSSINPLYAMVSTGPNDVFISGREGKQFTASAGGAQRVDLLDILNFEPRYDTARGLLDQHLSKTGYGDTNLFARDFARQMAGGIINNKAYDAALASSVPLNTTFPTTHLGSQLRAVANTVNVRNVINTNRQVFYVFMGGFDTHSDQTGAMPALHTEMSEAIVAFRAAMIETGAWDGVTLFTMSEFGRTMTDNGDGTDHGWGGHQFVAGGSVAGKHIYGDIPPPDLNTETYTPTHGRLIPNVSVEQYAATLGSWFGLDAGELATALPNLANFSQKNLGFI
jgi:uncharacterized protein (DUF1501 family)